MRLAATFSQIPSVAAMRPCREIAAEAFSTEYFASTIADRYGALTEELPLIGAAEMHRHNGGAMALIGYLRAAAPWLEAAIASLERQLQIQSWAGRPWLAWRPMLLAGPPGAGKSHLAKLIARFCRVGSGTLDLGGGSDSRALEGTARGWNNAQPCWPALMMAQTRTANPVLVLEEIDKAGSSPQGGSVHHVLLTMIERESAASYWDKCLLAPVDLSHVCWMLTCNDPSKLPPMLLSRLDVIHVDGPTAEDFDLLIVSMSADLARAWEVPIVSLPVLPAAALQALKSAFVQSRSARRLRRNLEAAFGALVPQTPRSTQ